MPKHKPIRQPNDPGWVMGLEWFCRLCTLVLLVALPWNYGSVSWGSQLWLAWIVAGLFVLSLPIAWSRRSPFIPGLFWPLAGLMLLAALQLIPLPPPIWNKISPRVGFQQKVSELADQYETMLSQDALSTTNTPVPPMDLGLENLSTTLSIAPQQTQASLTGFAMAAAFLISASILFSRRAWQLILLATISTTVGFHAILGLFQKVSWQEWTLLPMPGNVFFSTFVSRNTAPTYYAIGIGCVLGLLTWWLNKKRNVDAEKRYNVRYPAVDLLARFRRRMDDFFSELDTPSVAGLCVLTLFLVAVMATASRGGVLACLGAMAVTTVFVLGRREATLGHSAGMGILALVAVLLLGTLGLDEPLINRMNTVLSEAESEANPRYKVWLLAFSDASYWLAGSGLGTFHFAILPAQHYENSWTYHAESVYVETFMEFGILGALLMVLGIVQLLRALGKKRNSKQAAGHTAVAFSVFAIGLQSFVDFSLFVPAVFLSLVAIVGSFGGQQMRMLRKPPASSSNWRQWAAAAGLLACMLQGIPSLSGFAEGERLERLAKSGPQSFKIGTTEGMGPETRLQAARLRQANIEQQILSQSGWPAELSDLRPQLSTAEAVAAALRCSPLAPLGLLKEHLGQSTNLQDTLTFSADESLTALLECPQDWRASWALFRSDFGQLPPRTRAENYARLALLTNHIPRLQQRIGTVALWCGERNVGLDFWKRSLEQNPRWSRKLAPLAGSVLSVEDIKHVLPNTLEIGRLARMLHPTAPDLAQTLAQELEYDKLLAQAESSDDWQVVAWVAEVDNDLENQVRALRRAAELAPLNFRVRLKLVELLEAQGEISEAIHWMKQAIRRVQNSLPLRKRLEALEAQLPPK